MQKNYADELDLNMKVNVGSFDGEERKQVWKEFLWNGTLKEERQKQEGYNCRALGRKIHSHV